MVQSQLLPNKITDDRVSDAMAAIPRERFVPNALGGVAYADRDIEVAPGRHLVKPMVFARLLQAAEISGTDVVLDVGCATGYSTAVLAQLAGTVVALESDEELAARAEANLAELDIANAAVVVGPLKECCPDQGPYDVVFVNGSLPEIPRAMPRRLVDGGRLVAVVDTDGVGRATLVRRHGEMTSTQILFDAIVPPLPDFAVARGFVF